MKLENQVCSLELSKRLKELGVKQESLFYYQNQPFNDGTNDIVISIKEIISANNGNSIMNTYSMDEFDEPIYSAFTVSELSEMLPFPFCKDDFLFISKGPDFYNAYYNHTIHGLSYYGYICKSEKFSDCLANLLISVLENKLMELPNG